MSKLIDILPENLKKGLTPAEKEVLEKAPIGQEADFRVGDKEKDDPAKAHEWGPSRTIRAEFLYWLCTDEKATKLVHAKGINISGVKIHETLDFECAHLRRRLGLFYSAIPEGIQLMDATTRTLAFSGSHTGAISADRLKTEGSVFLKGAHAKGEVRLPGASIIGDLVCVDAVFENPKGDAFNAEGASVKGDAFLEGIKSRGEVRLLGANIDGQLSCKGAQFENPDGKAFSADRLSVKGNIFLDEIKAKGEVRLLGASIDGLLSCKGAEFENPDGNAFSADGASVKGDAFLDGIKSRGEVRLLGANIDGQLSCTGAEFENPDGKAFSADSASVKGGAFLDGIKSRGEVRLLGASIDGNLVCDDAELEKPKGRAFSADRLSAKGSVFLRRIKAKGEVRFLGASIDGNLVCNDAEFENPKGYAFSADDLSAKGSVFLRRIKAKGGVRFLGASIDGNFECNDAEFENPKGYVFIAENMRVKAGLFLRALTKVDGVLNLTGARVKHLLDDKEGWPKKEMLRLDGFEYDSFSGDETPTTAEKRLEWLRLQADKPFYPQPYEQLAKVFRRMGHEADARKVLIAKQDDLRKYGDLGFWAKLANRFWGFTLGHGYRIWPVVMLFVLFPLIGWAIFRWADTHTIMQPSKENVFLDPSYVSRETLPDEYPRLEPIVYSVDAFVPFVNLHQEDYWLPDITKPGQEVILGWSWGWFIRGYLWFHIIMGWVLTSLLVAYFTGKVRKE